MIYNKEDCKHHSIRARCCTKPGIPYTCKESNCGDFKVKTKSLHVKRNNNETNQTHKSS